MVATFEDMRQSVLEQTRDERQQCGLAWAITAFGGDAACDHAERFRRVAEEAIELAQAGGLTAEDCHKLVDYVFSRPVGEIHQEVGGLSLSTLILCEFLGISADAEESRELARVLSKAPTYFRARQAAKAAAGVGCAPIW